MVDHGDGAPCGPVWLRRVNASGAGQPLKTFPSRKSPSADLISNAPLGSRLSSSLICFAITGLIQKVERVILTPPGLTPFQRASPGETGGLLNGKPGPVFDPHGTYDTTFPFSFVTLATSK